MALIMSNKLKVILIGEMFSYCSNVGCITLFHEYLLRIHPRQMY